ncbi:sensor histidine kinase [Tenacibaculum amylolyticum]|uniref:sensor histidine kinase n=1 Tax=Tenacibaculum amylolyticum TaxID=104269 RepID=UPI0038963ED6
MNRFKKALLFFKVPLQHLLFWIGVYTYFISTNYDSGYIEALEHYAIYVFSQIVVAYTMLYFLIPRFLTPKKHFKFSIGLFILMTCVFIVFVVYHQYYYIPKYLEPHEKITYKAAEGFWRKALSFRAFLGKSILILTPTILLVIAKFYKEKQSYLELNEQKKSAELSVLKHQLNPHFLFNTLNNLYALTLHKSDEAPEVIAKLSEMLDYMLYGCNEQYVPLQKEIELIENYLALEKVRYDDRVTINFEKKGTTEVRIAPLILLTFIENAFKHGVSHALQKATITIRIAVQGTHILFDISNSIARNIAEETKERIGLTNVKKQLELLYSDSYSLTIKEAENWFYVHLKLPTK